MGFLTSTRLPEAGRRRWILAPLLVLFLLPPTVGARGAAGQSMATTVLQGTVLDGFDDPVANAVVTLWAGGVPTARETGTDRDGHFTFETLPPGRYDVRVEALGFHPAVLQGLAARPGSRLAVTIRLREGRPPVTVVDTSAAGVTSAEPDRWLDELELRAPAGFPDVIEALELVTAMDGRLGSLGLPSGYTTITLQGVPLRTATVAPGIQSAPAGLSLASVGMIRAAPLAPFSSFGLGGGGQVEVFNPTSTAGATEVSAAYVPSSLWAGEYSVPEGLSPSSFWASGRTTVDLVPDSLRVTVGADVQHLERPRQALFPGSSELGSPDIEEREMVSTYALLDWYPGPGSRVDFGARLGARPGARSRASLAYPRFPGSLDAKDMSLGAGIDTRMGPATRFLARLGVSLSERSVPGDWPLDAGTPFLVSVPEGLQGGVSPDRQGENIRKGLFGSLAIRHAMEEHEIEGGFEFLRSTHEIHPFGGSTLLVGSGDPFSDGWQGVASRFDESTDAKGFSVLDFAFFLRDTWQPTPNLRLRASGRWHRENLPVDDLPVDATWAVLTGVIPRPTGKSADGLGGSLGVDWLPGGAGSIRLKAEAGATVDEVDPWIFAEALASDGSVNRSTVVSGTEGFPAWPAFPAAPETTRSVPDLTLLPENMDLPASFFATVGVTSTRRGWAVGVSGTFRRTENLFRRSDLNRIAAPGGETESGRPVWGTPVQIGSLVVDDPGTSRRFTGYGNVWAVLQDGWSQYAGLTFFAERRPESGPQLSAWYTLSSTRDNLPGLGSGRAELATASSLPGSEDWTEGTSDLHVPHRLGAAAAVPLPLFGEGVWLRGRYRLFAGRPFTPGLRPGVDLDADGVAGNEPVWVPSDGLVGLGPEGDCAREQRGGFAERNSCTLPTVHELDVGLSVGLVRIGGGVLRVQVDGLNLLKAFDSTIDRALFLVDPAGTLQPDGTASSPGLEANPRFGKELYDTREGRMIRIGISWGGGA